MLDITNLHATVAGKPILNGLTLHVPSGEVHAIMGPNGAGKSTLAYVLAGRPGYEVTEGAVTFSPLPGREGPGVGSSGAASMADAELRSAPTPNPSLPGRGMDLLALSPHERAAAGLFLGFQFPVEIPGISYLHFLRES
jgi:Fe-S cluster assembly ATP-binding protein